MVARTGLFVAPVAGSPPVGTSPTDGRLVLGTLFGTTFNVLSGGAVTQSGSVMQFTVASAVWALPDPTNSAAVFASPSDVTILNGTAGPGTGSRIDSIAIKQNDNANGDADSRVQVILVTGVASGSPVAPTLAAGYSRYANITVPTSAANAAACTVTVVANPSTLAPQTIACTTLALLNTITGLPGQHATVTADSIGTNNADYRWSGVSWRPVSSAMQAIIPTSAVNATIGPNGTITITAQTTWSLNGCFTTQFDNYLLLANYASAAASAGISLKMRLSGTDAITNYNINKSELNSGGAQTNSNLAAQTSAPFHRTGAGGGSGEAKFFNPALAQATRVIALSTDADFFSSTSWISHTTATAYDGLTAASPQTVTGTWRLFGYNNL